MRFPEFDPFVLGLHYGDFGVRWYALAYVAGILLGWRFCIYLVRNQKLWEPQTPTATAPQIDDLVLWITLGVILGGRIGYVLFYMLPIEATRAAVIADPFTVLRVWEGGMSFHGGLIGVVIAAAAFARANGISLLRMGDLLAPAEPIGQGFGRIANFINGELWGRPTEGPYGVIFCNDRIRSLYGTCPAGEVPRHPSQLYEAGLEGLVLFLVLLFVTHRLKWLKRPGSVMGLFFVLYGAFRIALENVREPDQGLENLPWGLTMGMTLSLPMVIGGAVLLLWAFRPKSAVHEPA